LGRLAGSRRGLRGRGDVAGELQDVDVGEETPVESAFYEKRSLFASRASRFGLFRMLSLIRFKPVLCGVYDLALPSQKAQFGFSLRD
jgi:hypothetical protein